MITAEKLEIFNQYGGDNDGLERVGRSREKQLFDNDDWYVISNFYLDIELVKKGLASQSFADSLTSQLKKQCDAEAFDKLIRDISKQMEKK
jgi:hypothetical protein